MQHEQIGSMLTPEDIQWVIETYGYFPWDRQRGSRILKITHCLIRYNRRALNQILETYLALPSYEKQGGDK